MCKKTKLCETLYKHDTLEPKKNSDNMNLRTTSDFCDLRYFQSRMHRLTDEVQCRLSPGGPHKTAGTTEMVVRSYSLTTVDERWRGHLVSTDVYQRRATFRRAYTS